MNFIRTPELLLKRLTIAVFVVWLSVVPVTAQSEISSFGIQITGFGASIWHQQDGSAYTIGNNFHAASISNSRSSVSIDAFYGYVPSTVPVFDTNSTVGNFSFSLKNTNFSAKFGMCGFSHSDFSCTVDSREFTSDGGNGVVWYIQFPIRFYAGKHSFCLTPSFFYGSASWITENGSLYWVDGYPKLRSLYAGTLTFQTGIHHAGLLYTSVRPELYTTEESRFAYGFGQAAAAWYAFLKTTGSLTFGSAAAYLYATGNYDLDLTQSWGLVHYSSISDGEADMHILMLALYFLFESGGFTIQTVPGAAVCVYGTNSGSFYYKATSLVSDDSEYIDFTPYQFSGKTLPFLYINGSWTCSIKWNHTIIYPKIGLSKLFTVFFDVSEVFNETGSDDTASDTSLAEQIQTILFSGLALYVRISF